MQENMNQRKFKLSQDELDSMVNRKLPILISKIKVAKSPESVDIIGRKIEQNAVRRLRPMEIMMKKMVNANVVPN
jgi:hypothetical protein